MAATAGAGRDEALGGIEDWMADRWRQLGRLGSDAETAGRDALGWAARTGANFFAPRPSDVASAGAAFRDGPGAQARPVIVAEADPAQEVERIEVGEGPDHGAPEAMNLGLRFQAARRGDSISRMIGSSDPRAVGKFLSLNGMDGRDSTLRAGRSYIVPTRWDDASAGEARRGQALLGDDNARLRAVAERRAEVARQAQLLSEGRNIWTGKVVGSGAFPHSTTSPGDAQFALWDAEASRYSPVQRGLARFLAGARGAEDALTLGAGDYITSGAGAVRDALQGQALGAAFRNRMGRERLRDRYDEQRYPVSRGTGQIVGTGIGLLALGPADAALAGGVRMAEASPLIAREAAALGGIGATGGVASQGLEDLERRKLGSVGDYAGAAIGGATDALASIRVGPGQAGALGGAVTSISQDVLNGRRADWGKAGETALAGGYVAAPVGYAGRRYAKDLNSNQKGALGEKLGEYRTLLNFDRPIKGPKSRHYLPDGTYIYPDQRAARQLLSEQKMGRWAELTKGQKKALKLYGKDFRVDHFLERDIGVIYGFTPAQIASHSFLAADRGEP